MGASQWPPAILGHDRARAAGSKVPDLGNDKVTGVVIDWSTLTVVSGPTGPGADMGTVTVIKLHNNSTLSYAAPNTAGTFSLVYRICDTGGDAARRPPRSR
jgi:hypothetical protein